MKEEKGLIAFRFEQHPVRIVKDEAGEPWWVAKDVCEILSIVWKGSDNSGPLGSLDEDERSIRKVYTSGGMQEMATINESGLYALIFRSNKPQARVFRKWVTAEVLPAIRKTGSYAPGQTVVGLAAKLTVFLNDVASSGYCDFARLKEYCWLRSLGLTQDMASRACGFTSLHQVQAIDRRLKGVGVRFPNIQFAARKKLMDATFEKLLSSAVLDAVIPEPRKEVSHE